jgi:hypothetical protein
MMPKLDDNGDVVPRKVKTDGAKPYREERRTVETFQEYYISNTSQILEFIEMFCINPKVTEEHVSLKESAE